MAIAPTKTTRMRWWKTQTDEPPSLQPRTKSKGKLPPPPSSPDLSKQPVAKRTAAAAGLPEPSPSKKRAPPAARTKSLPPKSAANKLPLPRRIEEEERETARAAGALLTPAAGLCPRLAREKGFPSNILLD